MPAQRRRRADARSGGAGLLFRAVGIGNHTCIGLSASSSGLAAIFDRDLAITLLTT